MEMLTGKFPDQTERLHQLHSIHHHQPLQALVQKCLEMRKEDRPDASDVISEIEKRVGEIEEKKAEEKEEAEALAIKRVREEMESKVREAEERATLAEKRASKAETRASQAEKEAFSRRAKELPLRTRTKEGMKSSKLYIRSFLNVI